MPDLVSSHSALLLSVGVSLTLAIFHLWRAGEDRGVDPWLAIWAGLAVAHAIARWVEIHTTVPQTTIEVARIQVALAPLLVCTVFGFVRKLTGRLKWDSPTVSLALFSFAIAIAAVSTPWFVTEKTMLLKDAFGKPYQGAIAAPAFALIAIEIPFVLCWIARDIVRATTLDRREKTLLLASLAAYALLGLSSVAMGMGSTIVPGLAEYGPLAMAFGLSYLLVTQRRRLEFELEELVVERGRALLASEGRFRSLFDQSPIGACIVRADGTLESVNPSLLTIIGAPSAKSILERNLFPSEDDDATELGAKFRKCRDAGTVVTGDFQFTSSWGKSFDIRLIATPIHDDGEVVGVLGLLEDVTDRIQLEARLHRSQKLESVGQLAAGVAHEINNPMSYVRTNLGLLRSEWEALRKEVGSEAHADDTRWTECEELLDESLEGVERTVAIVRDMREFAHAGSEDRVACDLDRLVETCVRVSAPHRSGTTRISESYGGPAPVLASGGQLQQVIVNLLVNALQAAGDGGHVAITTEQAGNEAVVRVEDDGPGIPPADRERVFDPFFTTKQAGEGTGLGLYVSYQIVTAHDGLLEVRQSAAGGACFEMRLPIAS